MLTRHACEHLGAAPLTGLLPCMCRIFLGTVPSRTPAVICKQPGFCMSLLATRCLCLPQAETCMWVAVPCSRDGTLTP